MLSLYQAQMSLILKPKTRKIVLERNAMLNIDKARKEKGVAIVDMADYLGVRAQTVSDKISGTYDFKFTEALALQQKFFPEYDLEYLFTKAVETA